MMPRVLRAAIDTLEVSFYGEVSKEIADKLDALKSCALETPQPFAAGFVELMVQGKAFRFWRWRLVHPEFSIVMKKGGAHGSATAQVRFSAWGLANRTPADLWGLVRMTMECLGSFKPLKVSRCDVCIDFQGWTPTAEDMAGMVCAAAYRATHGTEKEIQTFVFGKGDTMMRVYNKTAELDVSHKGWMHDVWSQCPGYDPTQDVWRAEIQLLRKTLGELGVDSVEQVLADPGALLAFGLDWAQLRVPTNDSTKKRWPEDPRWTALRKAVFSGVPLQRGCMVSDVMSLDRAIRNYIGLVATAGAYFGETDFLKANQRLSFAAEVHMMDEGIDFAARVEEKRRRILSGEH